MRGMMWVFAVIILSVCETWTLDTGPSQSPLMSNASSSAPKVYVVRNASFNLESDVNLKCNDKLRSEMIYVIWKIHLKHKQCRISHENAHTDNTSSPDTCNDGKSLRNSSLHIPNFSIDDVGVYMCEMVYTGGADAFEINVDITAPPSISSWLERKGNKMTAVCKAERGKPAANISWSHIQNSSSLNTFDSDGFFTVESRLELPENMDTTNLSCMIRHPYWEEEKTLKPEVTVQPADLQFTLIYILPVVIIIAVLAGILFLAQKKLTSLMCCKQTDTSPSKPPPTAEDVEEVEPYASYVQRVNSIYNS